MHWQQLVGYKAGVSYYVLPGGLLIESLRGAATLGPMPPSDGYLFFASEMPIMSGQLPEAQAHLSCLDFRVFQRLFIRRAAVVL